VVVLALCVFGVKTFVGDVYRVNSTSMEPTVFEDEWVWVWYLDSKVERWDLVAVRHEGENLIKRAVALGADEVRIAAGDVLVGNSHLAADEARRALITVFDQATDSVEEHFDMGGTGANPWRDLPSGEWELDAREVERESALGLARLDRGELVLPGGQQAGDTLLECSLFVVETGGRVRLVLIEQGDTFQFSLELDGSGTGDAQLTRRSSAQLGETEVLAQASLAVETGRWIHLRFQNIDNHLRVEFDDGAHVLEASYDLNALHHSDIKFEGLSFGERVQLGGEGCVLRFKDIRVRRDLHYTQDGELGTSHTDGSSLPVRLDESGEIFVLGDNSAHSRDSRHFGPISKDAVRGKPLWVVWPPSAIRRL